MGVTATMLFMPPVGWMNTRRSRDTATSTTGLRCSRCNDLVVWLPVVVLALIQSNSGRSGRVARTTRNRMSHRSISVPSSVRSQGRRTLGLQSRTGPRLEIGGMKRHSSVDMAHQARARCCIVALRLCLRLVLVR